ncbi:MAG: tRNA (N(6)-L-threonylcarbamoyladenosine(37)-C(2))-methylthiotransferase MtaB [Nitrospirae bacterium]|nr:tRNA (N(6)-L-threonylcarbamoyladenosine(37)-C(2))-methylthiotransferase MtaB [Nitrospirota bacterium]
MKIAVLTLGCKTNLAESDYMKQLFLKRGHDLVKLKDSPDICVINTCTVTKKSDYQCRQIIRRALKTGARVYVTGCYSQISEEEIKRISPEIRIVRNDEKDYIINVIDDNTESKTSSKVRIDRARPFVKIQEGCNFRCSYCVIHRARGRSVSRQRDEIISEINLLEEAGYDEVVLTGTHIGLYGYDISGRPGLSELIEDILQNTKRIRIRLSSLEIHEIDDRLYQLLSEKRIRPHLHIPIQSADDRILSLMKRPYNLNMLQSKLKVLYDIKRDINLGTDIIVGFPTEGDSEFYNTYSFLKENRINYIHIFPYSDRPGTDASKMSEKVPEPVKRQRYDILKELDQSKRRGYRESQIGCAVEVVMERMAENGMIKGKSENYLDVMFEAKEFQKGKTVKVKILKQSGGVLVGSTY